MQPTDSLQLKGLNFSAGGKTLINNLSLSLPSACKVALLGLNGAGKSTLFQLLVGELAPDSGSIRFQNLSPVEPAFKDKSGYQAATMQALPGLTGRDYLELVCLTKSRTENKVADAIEQVAEQWQLQNILDTPMTQLSQGNLQKLIISQAFLGRPEYIFLDEPTQALDPVEQQRFTENLKQQRDYQLCLFSSHHLSETVETADWVLLLHRGQLIAKLDLNEQQQFWGTSQFTEAELKAVDGEIEIHLEHRGSATNLFQLIADQAQIDKFCAHCHAQEISFQLLGSGRSALMPLFSLLSKEAL